MIGRYLTPNSGALQKANWRMPAPTLSSDQAARHCLPPGKTSLQQALNSDCFYAKAVASKLTSARLRLLTPDLGLTGEWGTPLFSTAAKGLRYVDAPFPLSPFPDFILVDGRYRVACALECARRALEARSRATLMVDDYSYRPSYHCLEDYLDTPEIVGRAAFFVIGRRPVPDPRSKQRLLTSDSHKARGLASPGSGSSPRSSRQPASNR